MALIKCDFFSRSLEKCSTIYAVLPQRETSGQIGIESSCKSEKFKCLLLLHGLSDDESIWMRRTSVERYATEHGIAVIMPDADRSFYTDMKCGGKYYTYIAKEVLSVAREFFNISDKREDTFIAGNSMGGYGALKIGLRENDIFSAAVGISSVADIVERSIPKGEHYRDFKTTLIPVFGEEMVIPPEDDLFRLAKMKKENNEKFPALYLACGKNDYMYEDNLKLKAHLESLNIDFTYEENEGYSHSWEYWDLIIQHILNWLPL